MSLPALRFKEFSDNWEKRKLEEITKEKISYGIVQAGPHVEGGVPYIKSSNVGGIIDLVQLQRTSSDIHFKYRRSAVHPNDIVFSLRGNIGEVSIVPSEIHEANLTQGTARVSVDDSNNNKFVFFQMQTRKFLDSVNERSKGSTFQEISLGDLRLVGIMLSSITEQTKIANFLTAVDEKIHILTQKHDLLTQYKKGVMQQIFSQELRFKDEGGQDFPEWRVNCIGEVASFIKDGTHGTHQDTVDGEYLLLSAKNIKDGRIYYDESDRKISKLEFESIYKNYKLNDGDVLLSVVGTIGRVAIYSSEFHNVAFQRSVAFFRFNSQNSQFIAQLFTAKQFQNDLLTNQVVSAQAGIYLGDLSKIKVNLPCLTEQTKIANFLTAIDDKITTTQTQLQAVKQYKQGLLQQMFV